MTIELFKKEGSYKDKNGNDKKSTNFYLRCGSELIPVRVPYFPNEKCEGRDPQYQSRLAVLSSFASVLPEKNT